MKLVFDLTPIYDHLSGIERFNINITQNIIRAHPENEFVLLFKNEVHESFIEIVNQYKSVKTVIIPGCNKLFFIQWRLFRKLKTIEADYFIFLSFTSPILLRKNGIINAIHDLTCWDCPESIPFKMKYYYRLTFSIAVKRSWKIITVSQFSQIRICERFNLKKENVIVVYNGLSDVFLDDTLEEINPLEKYKLPNKYILSVSTIEPRKNLQLLIRAYIELVKASYHIPDLVLVGRSGWRMDEIVKNIDNRIKNRIHFTGFVDDKDLPQIYRKAVVFVYPSKYEGFGLPVIEAMSQGVIVLSSNIESLREITGSSGLYFASDSVDSLKERIIYSLSLDELEKNGLLEKFKQISHRYSWKNEASKVYDILMNQSK